MRKLKSLSEARKTKEDVLKDFDPFWKSAIAWKGAVLPRVMGRVLFFTFYSLFVVCAYINHPALNFDIGPFEVFGAGLGVLLVVRINSGYDRWWEARKLWGGIINQSRNLVISAFHYSHTNSEWKNKVRNWTIAFAHVCRRSLRGERDLPELKNLLTPEEVSSLTQSFHMPVDALAQLAHLFQAARTSEQLDSFAFIRLDRDRALLMDHIGGCERILKTPIPLVLAIQVRRLIFLFLLLVPFVLISKVGWFTPLVILVISYPLFSLDQISVELQNPFYVSHLSHLPLDEITEQLEATLLGLKES